MVVLNGNGVEHVTINPSEANGKGVDLRGCLFSFGCVGGYRTCTDGEWMVCWGIIVMRESNVAPLDVRYCGAIDYRSAIMAVCHCGRVHIEGSLQMLQSSQPHPLHVVVQHIVVPHVGVGYRTTRRTPSAPRGGAGWGNTNPSYTNPSPIPGTPKATLYPRTDPNLQLTNLLSRAIIHRGIVPTRITR